MIRSELCIKIVWNFCICHRSKLVKFSLSVAKNIFLVDNYHQILKKYADFNDTKYLIQMSFYIKIVILCYCHAYPKVNFLSSKLLRYTATSYFAKPMLLTSDLNQSILLSGESFSPTSLWKVIIILTRLLSDFYLSFYT